MAADTVRDAPRMARPTAEISAFFMPSILHRALFFPDPAERNDHVHGLLHVLPGHPFKPRVEVVFTREQIRRRQTHKGQPRAVGAASYGFRHHLEAAAADRLTRVVDDLRMPV